MNSSLISLYCPALARSIFIVEKAWGKRQQDRFWVDEHEGVPESISSLKMMLMIFLETILFHTDKSRHSNAHWTTAGFQINPFPEDTDHNTPAVVNFVTKGRTTNQAVLDVTFVSGKNYWSWSHAVFNEAVAFGRYTGNEFLSAKTKRKH